MYTQKPIKILLPHPQVRLLIWPWSWRQKVQVQVFSFLGDSQLIQGTYFSDSKVWSLGLVAACLKMSQCWQKRDGSDYSHAKGHNRLIWSNWKWSKGDGGKMRSQKYGFSKSFFILCFTICGHLRFHGKRNERFLEYFPSLIFFPCRRDRAMPTFRQIYITLLYTVYLLLVLCTMEIPILHIEMMWVQSPS